MPDLSILDIKWSIVPNLTLAKLPLTFNDSYLTIVPGYGGQQYGGFETMTNYTVSVTISNRKYAEFASRTHTI